MTTLEEGDLSSEQVDELSISALHAIDKHMVQQDVRDDVDETLSTEEGGRSDVTFTTPY